MRLHDIKIGTRFGMLRVLKRASDSSRPAFRCRCECGIVKTIRADHMLRAKHATVSCGRCEGGRTRRGAKRVRHGHRRGRRQSRLYGVWRNMLTRCYNPNVDEYAYYGGRGIAVCRRWRHSFEAFAADMGAPPLGFLLDRIDNDRGYTPANCRWATRKQSALNRRNTRWFALGDVRDSMSGWAQRLHVGEYTLRYHLRHWRTIEQIASALRR